MQKNLHQPKIPLKEQVAFFKFLYFEAIAYATQQAFSDASKFRLNCSNGEQFFMKIRMC